MLDRWKWKAMKLKIRKFVEANLAYYTAMAKAFPDETVWKRAKRDTEKLLRGR